MRMALLTSFFVLGFLARPGVAAEGQVAVASGVPSRVSVAESILYGAVIGAIVGAAASVMNAKDTPYQFSFFIGLGSAAGWGHSLLQPVPPPNTSSLRPKDGFSLSAGLFSWKF